MLSALALLILVPPSAAPQRTQPDAASARTAQGTRPTAQPLNVLLEGQAPPADLEAVLVGAHRVELAWTDRSSREIAFVVERREGTGDFEAIAETAADASGFVDLTVLSERDYAYRVRTRIEAGLTPPSESLRIRTPANRPPSIRWKHDPGDQLVVGRVEHLVLLVEDADRDPLRVRLLNPPPAMVLPPLDALATPATVDVRWRVPEESGGLRHLLFEVFDGEVTVRSTLQVLVAGKIANSSVATGDVTGDGALDLVVAAPYADYGVGADTGAIYVWDSGVASDSPSAVLMVPNSENGVYLGGGIGGYGGQGIQLVDLTGDGVLDVLCACSYTRTRRGSLYLWEGGSGLVGEVDPVVELYDPTLSTYSYLGAGVPGLSVLLTDLQGDGQLDVVAGCSAADRPGALDAGAILVWLGGPTVGLEHAGGPDATLIVPDARTGDNLGRSSYGYQAIQVYDVTGDGTRDVIALASYADSGNLGDTGEIYVWDGEDIFTGDTPPYATLRVPDARAYDRLGYNHGDLRVADVTGDGILDLVCAATYADLGTVYDAGSVYVWAGGPDLRDTVEPIASLHTFFPKPARLGWPLELADVDGDGILDVLAGAPIESANGNRSYVGFVYVFRGGPTLLGSVTETARLRMGGGNSSDYLGLNGIEAADVTGDGYLDVLACSQRIDVGGVVDAGAIVVWRGGPGLVGELQHDSRLTVPGAVLHDYLGIYGVELVDLTGDGQSEMVCVAPYANRGQATDAGAVYVWSPGPALQGDVAPLASLLPINPRSYDRLGYVTGETLQFADLDGDGLQDVLAYSYSADVAGVVDAGAGYVWRGGPTLVGSPSPHAVLSVPGARNGDALGYVSGPGLRIGDVTADGALDVVMGSRSADLATNDAGALFVWSELASSSPAGPTAMLHVPNAVVSDQLGRVGKGAGFLLLDVDRDGELDVLGLGCYADVAGVADAGALRWFWGASFLTGAVEPAGTFAVPGAKARDYLGF